MKVTTFRCDGCRTKLSEDDESRERCFELRTPFASAEIDICRECWDKMCAALGVTWDQRSGSFVRKEGR